MKLKVLSPYRSQHTEYLAGSVIEIDPVAGEFLMRDAPGCFEVFDKNPIQPEVETQEIETPPADKMIRRGGRSKQK